MMPTYVYKFIDTGETIEVQQAFNDPTLTENLHPVTGATMPVKKVFLPVGVTFKGTGFYKTDSRARAVRRARARRRRRRVVRGGVIFRRRHVRLVQLRRRRRVPRRVRLNPRVTGLTR